MKSNTCLKAVLASSLLLLLATGALAAHSRAYASATATASASAIGRNMRRRLHQGESVTASATAVGGPGAPSSANSQATGVPGQAVNCIVNSGPGEQKSASCPPSTPSGSSGQKSWAQADACKSTTQVTGKDQQGNPWGYENGKSCAIRNGNKP